MNKWIWMLACTFLAIYGVAILVSVPEDVMTPQLYFGGWGAIVFWCVGAILMFLWG